MKQRAPFIETDSLILNQVLILKPLTDLQLSELSNFIQNKILIATVITLYRLNKLQRNIDICSIENAYIIRLWSIIAIKHFTNTSYYTRIIHKKQSRNLAPMLGKQKWRSCSSQQTPRAAKLLTWEPPSLFVEPKYKKYLNAISLAI